MSILHQFSKNTTLLPVSDTFARRGLTSRSHAFVCGCGLFITAPGSTVSVELSHG